MDDLEDKYELMTFNASPYIVGNLNTIESIFCQKYIAPINPVCNCWLILLKFQLGDDEFGIHVST